MPLRSTAANRLCRAVAALALIAASSIVLQAPTLAAKDPSISLKPSTGQSGDSVRVTGEGFGVGSKVAIRWDGEDVANGFSDDGTFVIFFDVPAGADPGGHKVVACAYDEVECDAGTANAEFIVEPNPTKPPTPKPTSPPEPTDAPTAEPTPVRLPSPTPTGGFEPPPVVIPPDVDLAPIPWLANGSGPCSRQPMSAPFRVEDFESATGSWLGWVTSGERGTPDVATTSGQSAFGSVYDDFGSYQRPIILDFGQDAESEVAVHVGREQPRSGAGEVFVRLTGFGVDPTGSVIELAHASLSLEEAAVPIDRCLKITALGAIPFRMVTIDYLDEAGRSSTERRWIDDVTLAGAAPIRLGNSGNVGLPEVWIDSPLDGGAWTQSAPVRLQARIRDQSARPPTARVQVNGRAATPTIAISRAPGEDPFLYNLDVSLQVFHGLRADDMNEIELIAVSGSGGGSTHARTRFRFAPPVDGNLRVVGLEVTQAVQVPGNLIPLIADKKTVARVFVEGWPDGRGFWQNVELAVITTTANGTRRERILPIATSGSAADREATYWNVKDVLLDRAETGQGPLSIEVTIRSRDGRQQARLDDDRLATTVTFLPPIQYTAYGVLTSFPDGSTNSWDKLERFMRFVENVYPVSSAEILPIAGIGQTPQSVADIDALRELTGRLLMRLPPGKSIFGLQPGDATGCPGGCTGGGLASGRRTDGWGHVLAGPPVMAQELAHAENIGWHAETPPHPAGPADGWTNPAWPWGHSGTGHPGMDTREMAPRLISPARPGTDEHTHDFMSYGPAPSWTSPYTYCTLLERLSAGMQRCPQGASTFPYQRYAAMPAASTRAQQVRLASIVAPVAVDATAAPVEYLLISGEIAWDGRSATIEPLESMIRTADLPDVATGNAFALEIRDAAGAILVELPFTPFATHRHEGEAVPFEFAVPRPDGAASVAITRGDAILGEIRASANPPVISADKELLPARLDVPATLSWAATDADGDALTYAVEASFDDLQTWLPIGVGLTKPELLLDPQTLPGTGAAWLRVYASDGFNTSVGEAGPIEIPTHGPSIALRTPTDDRTVDQGAPVLLEVGSRDLEDGVLDGPAVTWTSDRDGALGEGRWLVVESLSVGEHVVTATATDADGLTAATTVRVTVRAAAQTGPSGAPSQAPEAPAAPGTTAVGQELLLGGLLALVLVGGLGALFVIRLRRRSA